MKNAIDASKEDHIPVSAVIRAVIKAGASLAEIMAALMPEKEEAMPEQIAKRVANGPDEH